MIRLVLGFEWSSFLQGTLRLCCCWGSVSCWVSRSVSSVDDSLFESSLVLKSFCVSVLVSYGIYVLGLDQCRSFGVPFI